MIDVVLDTNVLVATLLKDPGVSATCIRIILDNPEVFSLCYSSQMMDEYQEVLSRPAVRFRGLGAQAERLIALIRENSEEIIPKYIPALVYPDIKDKPFLEAAIYAKGILITNNLRDYPFLGVHVVTPADFVAWWQARCLENNREF